MVAGCFKSATSIYRSNPTYLNGVRLRLLLPVRKISAIKRHFTQKYFSKKKKLVSLLTWRKRIIVIT